MRDILKLGELLGSFTKKPRVTNDSLGIRSDVEVTVRDKDGNIKSHSIQHNLRTNGGANFWNTQLFSASPGSLGANYIGLTTDGAAASASDTVLASEITEASLARIQVTPTHTTNTNVTTFTNIWTYDGGGAGTYTIAKAGLFTDTHANGGTLVLESLLNATALLNSNGDTLTLTWTITY